VIHLCWKILFPFLLLAGLGALEFPAHGKLTVAGQFGTETTIDWCGCGSPSQIVRGSNTAAPETTSFQFNLHGAVTKVTLPNNTTVTNKFDLLGRLSIREDALMKVTNTYDNLDRLVARHNAFGLLGGTGYDHRNRAIASTNSSGVWSTNQYDHLSRVIARGYPSGGKEHWGYTLGFAEATSHTNQVSKVTTWKFDAAQRLTNEVGVTVYTNSFTYSPAGDLRELLDGKNQKTAWSYNAEGLVASKTNQANARILAYSYNANGLLTNRWSAAKGNTAYGYDRVGNLTSMGYPVSPAISYQYSALNRMTNMVDAAGTTRFNYNLAGDLLTETWPAPNGPVVTYGYHSSVPHLRTSVSLSQPAGAWTQTYQYDAAHRLQTVASPAGTFTYTYNPGVGSVAAASPLVRRISLPNTSYITNVFDTTGRLMDSRLKNSTHADLNRHSYVYNNANQRTKHTRWDSSYVNYTYDNIGQLESALGFASGGTPLSNDQRGYRYDPAWNLNARTNNGVVTTFGVNVTRLSKGSVPSIDTITALVTVVAHGQKVED
jgi:YD repeat-containing protein